MKALAFTIHSLRKLEAHLLEHTYPSMVAETQKTLLKAEGYYFLLCMLLQVTSFTLLNYSVNCQNHTSFTFPISKWSTLVIFYQRKLFVTYYVLIAPRQISCLSCQAVFFTPHPAVRLKYIRPYPTTESWASVYFSKVS